MSRSAAIVTIGSELTLGLRIDTNTAEIARGLTPRGFRVAESTSVPDDMAVLADVLKRLTTAYELVIATGGLGPTHDDITRQAASEALGTPLVRDTRLERLLEPVIRRYAVPDAGARVLVQADVPVGAEVIDPTTGTAPGLVIPSPAGSLVLLPGPPAEMRPMLESLLARYPLTRSLPRELGVAQMTESDAQALVDGALGTRAGIGFTILARPGDVRVVLTDEGAGESSLDEAVASAAEALGDHCYCRDGSTLAATVIREATLRGATISTAESCTGGMVSAALTDIAGSSSAFLGGVVSYSDSAKVELLGVPNALLSRHGAVSGEVAAAMAEGVRERFGSVFAVSITGIAGPGGGTEEKPVGTVWFALSAEGVATQSFVRRFHGTSRQSIRDRATATALDTLRRAVLGLPLS